MFTSYGLIIEFSRNENYKSTESFCLTILAIYTNDWSPIWHVYCYHVYFFFCEIPKYVQAKNRLAHLDWHFMEWASMLTNLAGIMMNTGWFGSLSFLGSSHHVISFLLSHFCFFQNAILRIVSKLQFWILKPIFLRI